MNDAQIANNLGEEIDDMIESIQAVKGNRYADMIRLMFNNTNYQAFSHRVIEKLGGSGEVIHILTELEEELFTEMLLLFAKLWIGTADKDIPAAKSFIAEFTDDLVSLAKKQLEYNVEGGKGS